MVEAIRQELADTVGAPAGRAPVSPARAEEPAAEAEPSLEGSELDHFSVGALLGRGGMGSVYLGHDRSLDRPVALKVLRDAGSGDPLLEQRFLREARVQAGLNHPNVVHLYYIGRRPGGALFFAMERVDGGTLDDVLQRGERLEPEAARRAMIEVVRGLRAGHKAGIIHRDVKPGNILRSSADGRVKIADFGLARPVRAAAAAPAEEGAGAGAGHGGVDVRDKRLTHDGMMVGSPWYIAPEQAMALPVDHRADMYGLGATFYHLLSGEPVFDGVTAVEVAQAHVSREARPLAEVAPEVPAPLAAIVDRLLRKAPAERYESYDALLEALDAAAPTRQVYAGFWTRAAAALLDGTLAAGLIFLVGWPGLLAHLVHVTVGHAARGQSLGKYLLRIAVRDAHDPQRGIGLPRAMVRTVVGLWLPFAALVTLAATGGTETLARVFDTVAPHRLEDVEATMTLVATTMGGFLTLLYGGGLALAALNPKKRALHDLVVQSVVRYEM